MSAPRKPRSSLVTRAGRRPRNFPPEREVGRSNRPWRVEKALRMRGFLVYRPVTRSAHKGPSARLGLNPGPIRLARRPGHTIRPMRMKVLLAALVVIAGLVVPAARIAAAGGGQVFVNCEVFVRNNFSYRPSVRPRTCTMQGLPISGAREWKLSKLRWSGWGTGSAVATGLYHYRHGVERGGKLIYPVVPLRIALFRIRTGCDGRRYYTRATAGEQTNRLSESCTATLD